MGKQTERSPPEAAKLGSNQKSPPEAEKLWSNQKSPPEATKLRGHQRSPSTPKPGSRSIHKLDKFESPQDSLSKSSDSPRLSLAFSNGSANNISPRGAKHAKSASKQLDFSSSGSVSSSKNGTQVSPKGVAPRLLLDTLNGVGGNSSGRLSQDSPGGKEKAVADDPCGSISTDELRQIEKILQASSSRLEELYKKVLEIAPI
jgi:hypothetical protein